MSTAADRPDGPSFEPTDPPEFALDFLVDDEVEPSELTIFSPEGDDITTQWITVEIDAAVPIEAVR